MSLTKLAVDVLGVVTICLVVLLALLGLFCIIYTLYFRSRIRRSGFLQLGYFNGPWVVRISLVLFGIWWGVGEIVRLSLFRQKGSFDFLGSKWQEDMCKYYVLANLGFTEPCLFLIMCFLLRASLQWRGSEILNHKWNLRTAIYILLYCLPVFVLDLIVVMIGPTFDQGKNTVLRLPHSFTHTTRSLQTDDKSVITICSYPLLCTILHGLFAVLLTAYLLLVGRRMVASVINKGLRKRVYILIFLVSCFLPLRVILLGFSALAKPHILFEALAFSGFIALLSCVVVGIYMLVYLPVADSLTLSRGLLGADNGAGRPYSASVEEIYNYNDSIALFSTGQGPDTSNPPPFSTGRSSDDSTKPGSISFRMLIKDDPCRASASEEEMLILSPGLNRHQLSSPASSPGTPSFIF